MGVVGPASRDFSVVTVGVGEGREEGRGIPPPPRLLSIKK